jgi:hypothetical protein
MFVTQGMRISEKPAAEKRSLWVIKKLQKKLDGWAIRPTPLKHKTENCKDGKSGFFTQSIGLVFAVDGQKLTYKIEVEVRKFLTRLKLKNPNGMRLAYVEAKKDVVSFCEEIDKVLEKDFTRAIFDVQLKDGIKRLNRHIGLKATLTTNTYDTNYELTLKIGKNCAVGQARKRRYGTVTEYRFLVLIRDGSYIFKSRDADNYEYEVHLGDPNLAKAVDEGVVRALPEVCRQCYMEEAMSTMGDYDFIDHFKSLHRSLVGAGFSVPTNDPDVQNFLTELDKAIAMMTDIREKLR